MMIEALLLLVADGMISALAGTFTDELAKRLRNDPARHALQQALGAAIQRYATAGSRLELAEPLLRHDGPLTQLAVAEELARVLSFNQKPNLNLIGDRWRAALDHPPSWRDFTEEARLFVSHLEDELRTTDVFRPAFDSRSLDAMAMNTAATVESLAAVVTQLANLTSLVDARFGTLARQFSAAPAGIRDQIRDYSRYIEEKTRGFVGRQFVFDAIGQFVAQHPRGYFIVRGDPGIGKSALMAHLVKTQAPVHHFNIRAEGISRPEQCLRNLCAQLITRYRLSHTELPSEATQDAGFLNRLLNEVVDKLADGEKAVIVVDALDEVDGVGSPAGANVLYLPLTLPHGLFIVTTTRKVPLNLRIECEQRTLDIEHDSAGNIADIRLYVEQAVGQPGIRRYIAMQGMDDEQFVEHLIEKSQGNFIYLRYVLPEIEQGTYKDLDLDALPIGLRNYYEDHWRRMRGQDEDAWFRYKLPVVMSLTVAREPVSIDLIAEFSGVQERARIRAVLNEWSQFLHQEQVDYEGGVQRRYRIYHASFHDFIAEKEEVADERVSRRAARQRIADLLWKDLYTNGG
jgi:hypothetical protein